MGRSSRQRIMHSLGMWSLLGFGIGTIQRVVNVLSAIPTLRLLIFLALSAAGAGCGNHANVSFDLSPDGKFIVFSAADGDLYLIQLASDSVVQLTQTPDQESTPSFSPDGKGIVFAAGTEESSKSLFAMSLVDKQITRLTNAAPHSDRSPRYSPDATHVAFSRSHRYRPYSMGGWTWDDWDVYVMRIDDREPQRVSEQKSRGPNNVDFVGGSNRLIFSAERDLRSQLFELEIIPDAMPVLLEPAPEDYKGGSWASRPDLSADSRWVVFVSDRKTSFAYDLMLLDRQAGNRVTSLGVTRVSAYNMDPKFTPDGNGVVFLAGAETRTLWRVDVRTGQTERWATSRLFSNPLRWKGER